MSDAALTIITEEPVETKLSKLTQLAQARESAKTKRKQRDEDLSAVNVKLDKLAQLMEAKQEAKAPAVIEEEAPPVKKRKVVVIRQETEDEPQPQELPPSWWQSIFRTGAVLALGAGSYYMQNVYGKQKAIKAPPKPQAAKPVVPVWSESKGKSKVGESGFLL